MKIASALALALAACAQPDAVPPGDEFMECDAAPVQRLIGQRYQERIGSEAMRGSKSRSLRVTRPGQAVTMDYRTDRLNIDLDERDVIRRVSCG